MSEFGFDFANFFQAFIIFLGAYFGSKQGTKNGNGK